MALAEGKTWKVVTTDLHISMATLAKWTKEPEFQAKIDEHIDAIVAEARRILRRNAGRAATRLAVLMDHGHTQHSVQLAAAKDLLDRGGLKPVDKHEVTGKDGNALTIRWEYGDSDGSAS